MSLLILRVTLQCTGISTYVQHKVPVPVLLCALTPSVGVRTPSYTARDDEVAVPSGGVPPCIYRGGPLHIQTQTPRSHSPATEGQGTPTTSSAPRRHWHDRECLEVQTRSRHQQYSDTLVVYVEGGPPLYIYMGGGGGGPLYIEGGPPLHAYMQYSWGYVPPLRGVSAYSRTATGTLC